MFARGKLLHLCSPLVKALSSMQFCDQTLGRAQGLVGFHTQGLTGFHTQELVWFMLRNFWILFSEVSGILWPNQGARSRTCRSSIPWPLSLVQVRGFPPLGPGLRSSQGQPVLSLAHFSLHLKAQHLFSWFYPTYSMEMTPDISFCLLHPKPRLRFLGLVAQKMSRT